MLGGCCGGEGCGDSFSASPLRCLMGGSLLVIAEGLDGVLSPDDTFVCADIMLKFDALRM